MPFCVDYYFHGCYDHHLLSQRIYCGYMYVSICHHQHVFRNFDVFKYKRWNTYWIYIEMERLFSGHRNLQRISVLKWKNQTKPNHTVINETNPHIDSYYCVIFHLIPHCLSLRLPLRLHFFWGKCRANFN